ncbi:MAG: winged helix-turn-helix transcriptional regulator [Candidatus Lokiarchaeota archaeon]|nr:winged helix-turn-helix transcriptional regulator [Candidatus Lokiarchaeota archaeon]
MNTQLKKKDGKLKLSHRLSGYDLKNLYFLSIILAFTLSNIIIAVQARTETIAGYSISDEVSGNEGWVEYQFARNNQFRIISNVTIDLQIDINSHLGNRQLNFNITNKNNISLRIYNEPFETKFQNRRYRTGNNRFKNQWNAYLKIEINDSIDNLELSAIVDSEQNIGANDKWSLYTEEDGWKTLETEVTNTDEEAITTTVINSETELYVSVFTPALDISLLIALVIVSISFLSVIIVFSKSEYREFIKNRIIKHTDSVHRLSIDDVLENENRSTIIDLILDHPGIHFNELLRQTELSPGNLVWHLDILETYKIIGKKNIGQYVVYFPYYNSNPMSNIDIKLAKSRVTVQILNIIEENPGTYANKIAKNLDLDHKTIKYHIDKLITNKLVEIRKNGRKKELFPIIGNIEEINIERGSD